MKHWTFLLSLILIVGISSCKKDGLNEEEQLAIDIEKIENYLEVHQLTAEKTSSGLYYHIINSGAGTHPDINSNVRVNYTGRLIDGTVFEKDVTTNFALSSVIEGWQEGIPLIKTGGKCRLYIPSKLAYGDKQVGSIPANSVLIFDIHLISFH